jgi:hypothetical protein
MEGDARGNLVSPKKGIPNQALAEAPENILRNRPGCSARVRIHNMDFLTTGHDMNTTEQDESTQAEFLDDLTSQLIERHGAVLGSRALARELGYPSASAFQQALVRNTVPFTVFKLPNRRGHFALTIEVARWLSKVRDQANPST